MRDQTIDIKQFYDIIILCISLQRLREVMLLATKTLWSKLDRQGTWQIKGAAKGAKRVKTREIVMFCVIPQLQNWPRGSLMYTIAVQNVLNLYRSTAVQNQILSSYSHDQGAPGSGSVLAKTFNCNGIIRITKPVVFFWKYATKHLLAYEVLS